MRSILRGRAGFWGFIISQQLFILTVVFSGGFMQNFFATCVENYGLKMLQFSYGPQDVSRGDPASRFTAAVQTEILEL